MSIVSSAMNPKVSSPKTKVIQNTKKARLKSSAIKKRFINLQFCLSGSQDFFADTTTEAPNRVSSVGSPTVRERLYAGDLNISGQSQTTILEARPYGWATDSV